MASQPVGGLRGFVQKPLGKVLLIAFCALAVAGTFAYVSPLLAIPVFLFLGLALPILWGLKRPRYLALSGLVVIIVVAPVANAAFTNMILTPVGAASSDPNAPFGAGGSVLQNATVSPFSGDSGTNFTWTVTIDPSHLPAALNVTDWKANLLQLFISTCPGAINATESYCGSGYALTVLNHTFTANFTTPKQVVFNYTVGTVGIWSWQMGLRVENSTTHNNTSILLMGDPTWNGIEGPVIGGFWTVYGALIADIYFSAFLYLGLPFYFLLLLYLFLKNRERRRLDYQARAAGSIPPAGTAPPEAPSGPPGEAAPTSAARPLASEATCPSCQAVVYPNETKCWKCGADLKPSPPATP